MARRRYIVPDLVLQGRSKPRTAYMDGICVACAKPFHIGDPICFDSIPYPKARYHEACPSVKHAHPDAPAPKSKLRDPEPEPEIVEYVDEGENDARRNANEAPRRHDASIDALIDARIAAALGDFKPAEAVNADRAREIAEATIDEESIKALVAKLVAPVSVKIEVKAPDGKVRKIDKAHYLMPRLLKLLGGNFHVYLWGPAGSGKTTAAIQAAEVLGRKVEVDTLDPTTPKSSILGYRTPTGEPVHTAFTRRFGGKDAGVYVADEIDNAPAHVQTLFNSALANSAAPAAWGSIMKSDKFCFIGTGNTPGFPTHSFPDRRPMSAAFKDRLYFMFWPLDPAIECRAAGLPTPPPPERIVRTCSAAAWVTWVRAVREWTTQHEPTIMVTPRASLLGLEALTLGESLDEIADALVFRGADQGLREKVLRAVPLP